MIAEKSVEAEYFIRSTSEAVIVRSEIGAILIKKLANGEEENASAPFGR